MGMTSSDVVAGTNATDDQYNNLRKDINNAVKDPVADTDGATIALDLATGAIHKATLGGNRTITFNNAVAGQFFTVILKQDGTGSRTATWPTTKWSDATTPVLTTTAGRVDIFAFYYDGTDYYGTIVGQNYG